MKSGALIDERIIIGAQLIMVIHVAKYFMREEKKYMKMVLRNILLLYE